MPDGNKQSTYGGGFITGIVIGIPRAATHARASWEFVCYLGTDTARW
ncbi:hypothetical protein [Actinomadura sp. KC06]|nr:hypothetical protein [Actinomadura sp. KC06]